MALLGRERGSKFGDLHFAQISGAISVQSFSRTRHYVGNRDPCADNVRGNIHTRLLLDPPQERAETTQRILGDDPTRGLA